MTKMIDKRTQKKIDNVNRIFGDRYEIKGLTEKNGVLYMNMLHKDCNTTQEVSYPYLIKYKKYRCNGCYKLEKLQDKQQILDGVFGKDQITLLEFTKYSEKCKIRVNKCNHEHEIYFSALKNRKSTEYLCSKCDNVSYSGKPIRVLNRDEIQRRLNERFNNRIIYIGGYLEDGTTKCKFKFRNCNHEFESYWGSMMNSNHPEKLRCQICDNDIVKNHHRMINKIKYSNQEIEGRDPSRRLAYLIKCNDCGEITGSVSPHRIGKFIKTNCDCENINQNQIVDNYLDLFYQGKTNNKNKYLDIDHIKAFQTKRTVNYKIKESMTDVILDNVNTLNFSIRKTKELKLPSDKIRIDLSDCNIQFVNNRTTYKMLEVVALNVDGLFGVKTIVNVVYSTSKSTFSSSSAIIEGRSARLFGYNKGSHSYAMTNYAYGVLETLTNLHNNDKVLKIGKSQNNNSLTTNLFNNSVGVVERRVVYKNMKTKYLYIRDNGVTTTKRIYANFTVAGHYRHYVKTNKRIFISPFEKGKQYRHIRRIEKDYIIK